MLMLGNEAVARGAYEAGCTVATAYPGTPSTEITEYIAQKYDEIYSEWAPNEKVALEVAIGASIIGARAMCSMKHVGLNVAADPLFTASYTGVGGGLVICVADDPGMHSSQNEQDTRMLGIASKVMVLEPSDSQECKDFVKEAFSLSELFDTPVIVRLSTRVSHSQSIVEIADRNDYTYKKYEKNPLKYVMMPAMARKRHVEVVKRLSKIKEFAESCGLNKIEMNDTKIGVITSGVAYQYAKEALPDASFLKLGIVNPLPEKLIIEFAEKVEKLYVIEELEPVIENHCRRLGLEVIGKEIFTPIGEYSVKMIKEAVLGEKVESFAEVNEEIPLRPPVMCTGCPHRGVHYILSKLGLVVNGDIGCYTLGAQKPLSSIHTCVCMGASIGMNHGMEKAMGKDFSKKSVAIIGDSTFIHSGITGLIDAVYNKGTSTIIILDNSITGMTGHQDNPATGYTIKGEKTVATDLVKLCQAVGVRRVKVVDPYDLETLEKTIKEELNAEEVSVIISQRPCALLKYVKFSGKKCIDQSLCKKCKACLRIACPSISFKDNMVVIDKNQCVGCGLCQKVCRFGAILDEE